MKRLIYSLALMGLAFMAGPANAFVYSINWHNVMGDGNFPTFGTSVNIGSTNQSSACGSILAGDLLVAVVAVQTGGSDPGQPTTPTGFTAAPAGAGAGWTSAANTVFRSAVFYKVAAGGETCSFTTSWANTASGGGLSWVLMDFRRTGGSTPGTTIDSQNSQVYFDNTVGGVSDAPSATLTNSGDLLLTVYAENGGLYQLTKPAGQTTIADTFAEGGAFFSLEVLTAYDTSNPGAGATGTRRATYTNSFVYFIDGSIGFNQPSGGGSSSSFGGLTMGLGVGH